MRRAANDPMGLLDRRGFLFGAGAARMAAGTGMGLAFAQIADYSLRIAPMRLELAPEKVIDTYGYNGTVPGPVLRLREGHSVSINISNNSDIDDINHWHGLYVPANSDGAVEEGSPIIPCGETRRYNFTAKPSGTRWYHSHDMAHSDLTSTQGFMASSSSRPQLIPADTTARCCLLRIIGKGRG